MDKKQIKAVNWVYFATVVVSCVAPYLGIGALTDNYLVLLAISQALLVLPTAVYLIGKKVNYKEAVRLNKVKPSTVILLVLLTFLLMPLLTLINALSMVFATNSTADYMQTLSGQNSLLVSIIGVALIPCILEESVYRGVFYNEYRKEKPIAAIFLSALLFALLHGNFNQFSYALIMGILFALVIEATNSIVSTMIIHFVINANSIVLTYALPKLVWYLQGLYRNAELLGNTEEMAQIQSMFGEGGMDLNSLLESSDAAIAQMGVTDVLQTYGFSALTCTILAFIVYRTIAMSNGQWNRIKEMFRRKPAVPEQEAQVHIRYTLEPEEESPKKEKKERLITLPLLAGMIIMLIEMIALELT